MDKDEALRMALEALETNVAWFTPETMVGQANITRSNNAITAIKEALAQPEQEPVAWMHEWNGCVQINKLPAECYGDHWTRTALYTSTPKRKLLEGVIEVKPIGHHSLQLVFDSQASIAEFKLTNGIKE